MFKQKHLKVHKGNPLIYGFLIFLCVIVLYPCLNQVAIAFNSGKDTARGGVTIWPRIFTLTNFELVFRDRRIFQSFYISFARTIIGTIGKLAVTMTCAYAMSRDDLIGQRFYTIIFVITMYFSGGLIPSFILMRQLGLYNSFWVMIIPGLMSVWDMIIFRTFFRGIPQELEDSARIDGASNWGIYLRSFYRCPLRL